MPEVPECRKCAGCCIGCLFLDYDKDTALFSCMIYLNKMRRPLRVYEFMPEGYKVDYDNGIPMRHWFGVEGIISDMMKEPTKYHEYDVCHGYICTVDIELHPKLKKQLKDTVGRYNKILKHVEVCRKSLGNFDTLVEILNCPD